MLSQQTLKLHESTLRFYSALSEEVIGNLMCEISIFYVSTKNIRIARLMIRIFKDEKLSKETRYIAYVFFLGVIGRCVEERPIPHLFFIPDDVNWLLVNRYGTIIGNVGIVCHRIWQWLTLRESEW